MNPSSSCDRQCWKEGLHHFDVASVVVENGELYTINLCESCHNPRQGETKEPKVNGMQWKRLVGLKGSRGTLAAGLGAEQCHGGIESGKEWLEESPRREELALLQGSKNMQLPGMVRKAIQARQEDDQRKSVAQQVLQKSTDLLRRIFAPVQGHGVTLSYVCPHCHRFPPEDYQKREKRRERRQEKERAREMREPR